MTDTRTKKNTKRADGANTHSDNCYAVRQLICIELLSLVSGNKHCVGLLIRFVYPQVTEQSQGDEVELLEQFLQSTLGAATGLFAAVVLIRKASKDADDDLNKEKRESLAEDLLCIKKLNPESWVPDFTLVFDRFFGRKHFRWRCFYRSALISLLTFLVLFVTARIPVEAEGILIYFGAAVVFNVFMDYLSLLETRYLLNTSMQISLKILIDAVLTFVMSLGWLMLILWFFLGEYPEDIWDTFTMPGGTNNSTGIAEMPQIFRVIVVTSFTTSIWLWLHGLSRLAIRAFSSVTYVMEWLNVEEKPLRAIGATINIFVLLIGAVLFPVYVLAS